MKDTKRKESLAHDEKFSTTSNLILKKPIIKNKLEDKFKSLLFLPQYNGRKGEGGLRTKSYFKQSLPNKPLVSIITVVFNGEKYLEQTIQSVINQTYDNVEYIIIDGGSTDNTLDIIKKYEHTIDYWVSEKDNGIYHAMNKGILLATGEIIGIINSDDWFQFDTIEKVVNVSKDAPEKEFIIHGKIALFNANKDFVGERSPKKIPWYHLFSTPFKHPAMFVSKKLYNRIGLYDETLGLAADYDMMLRIISSGSYNIFISKVLTNVRKVGISTGGHSRATNKELIKIIKRNTGSWFKAFFAMGIRVINRFIKS